MLEQEEKDPERARRSFCRSWCEMWFYIARSSERKNSGKIDFSAFFHIGISCTVCTVVLWILGALLILLTGKK